MDEKNIPDISASLLKDLCGRVEQTYGRAVSTPLQFEALAYDILRRAVKLITAISFRIAFRRNDYAGGGFATLAWLRGAEETEKSGTCDFFLKRTEKDLHGFCRICTFASRMKPSFHFSPVLSGTLEHPYIRLERNEKEDFFVKFLII